MEIPKIIHNFFDIILKIGALLKAEYLSCRWQEINSPSNPHIPAVGTWQTCFQTVYKYKFV